MARSRAIQAEFFDSEQLARVCRDARLLFIGLWLIADHWGVVHNVPTKIRAAIFPFDDEGSPFAVTETEFRQWLESLFELKFILRFEYRGRRYIYIRSWEEHQTIQHREKQKHNAIIPPDVLKTIVADLLDEDQPPLPNLAPSGKQNGKSIPNESGTNPDQIGNESGTDPEPIPNGSGSDPDRSQGKVTVREGKLREGEQSPGAPTRVPIGKLKKKEQEAVWALEKGGSLLRRFKEFLNKQKNQKILKKVWHDQRFQAPTIRTLAVEFMNSEKDPDQEAVNEQESESGKGTNQEPEGKA